MPIANVKLAVENEYEEILEEKVQNFLSEILCGK